MTDGKPIAFVWKNLGPSHHDRLRAVHRAGHAVLAVQLFANSQTYEWESGRGADYRIATIASTAGGIGPIRLTWRLFRTIAAAGARDVFLCDYQRPAIALAAWMLKLSGRRIFTMLDSKFDDYPRRWPKTIAKIIALSPYRGALVAAERSRDYAAYLGIARERIALGFDSLDLARLRDQSGGGTPPPFAGRPFLSVARLVPKKNLGGALAAFARYRRELGGHRRFVIAGYGPLEHALREQAESLGIADAVEFLGPQSSAAVTGLMRDALALVLASTEEQFGLVAIEAFAMGLPVIISRNAGAADNLVGNLVSGFVIDPSDGEQLLAAMAMLDRDEALHARMVRAALAAGERGDVRHFVAGVEQLARPKTNA